MRMIAGAERLCMPAPSVDQFVQAVKQTVLANKHWVCLFDWKTLIIPWSSSLFPDTPHLLLFPPLPLVDPERRE